MTQPMKYIRHIKMTIPLVILAGCATPTADSATAEALEQLATYQSQVKAKVVAENRYYDTVLENTERNIVFLWENEHPWKFEREVIAFAKANASSNGERIAGALPNFITSTERSWATREASYQKLLSDALKDLNDNRQKLSDANAKVTALRNQLRALVSTDDKKSALNFATAYVRAVYGAYQEPSETKE